MRQVLTRVSRRVPLTHDAFRSDRLAGGVNQLSLPQSVWSAVALVTAAVELVMMLAHLRFGSDASSGAMKHSLDCSIVRLYHRLPRHDFAADNDGRYASAILLPVWIVCSCLAFKTLRGSD